MEVKRHHSKTVTIVGAGFSGLVSAYFLSRAGYTVTVLDESNRIGGMIETVDTDFGRIETAANGILGSVAFEKICKEIGIAVRPARKESNRRYFFRAGRLRRWPLSITESIVFIFKLVLIFFRKPRVNESVKQWGNRALGRGATRYLIAPALQGIYAGDIDELNASSIFDRFFSRSRVTQRADKKASRPEFRGTVSVAGGMEAFLKKLASYLQEKGVVLKLGENTSERIKLRLLRESPEPLLFAVSASRAATLFGDSHLSAALDFLPLVSVSLAFPVRADDRDGFGCLFPRGEGVRSLGVLFENSIFGDRSKYRLERWILGGATDRLILQSSDAEIITAILSDREKAFSKNEKPIGVHVRRWNQALPSYNHALAEWLRSPWREKLRDRGIYAIGNYTGRIGLSGILSAAERLPEEING